MKNTINVSKIRLIGIIAFVAVIGLSFTACPPGGDSGPSSIAPATSGQLTITNIHSDYNGKYIGAMGTDGTDYFAAAADIVDDDDFIICERINNGKAVLKVWKANIATEEISGYSGSDTISFDIGVFNSSSFGSGTVPVAGEMAATITFSNGKKTYDGSGIGNLTP